DGMQHVHALRRVLLRGPPRSTPLPYTTLFRSHTSREQRRRRGGVRSGPHPRRAGTTGLRARALGRGGAGARGARRGPLRRVRSRDRKSTRLNSSHVKISYAVFCLKKKNKEDTL